jgi:hypothetical protein
MSFLYFVPGGGDRLPPAELEKLGLGYALPAEGEPLGRKSSGPEGQVGFLFDPTPGAETPPAFLAEGQTWRKGPEGKYWVGFNKATRPIEAVMRRPKFIGGEPVKLRDGGDWIIPVARSLVGGATLPRKPVLLDDCKTWRLETLPEFLGLCKAAERVFELMTTKPGAEAPADPVQPEPVKFDMDYDEAMGIVVHAMSVNYRLTALELSLLELFTDVEIWAVFRALIDWNGFARMVAAQSKKPPASA